MGFLLSSNAMLECSVIELNGSSSLAEPQAIIYSITWHGFIRNYALVFHCVYEYKLHSISGCRNWSLSEHK